jgi:hypothetical protein
MPRAATPRPQAAANSTGLRARRRVNQSRGGPLSDAISKRENRPPAVPLATATISPGTISEASMPVADQAKVGGVAVDRHCHQAGQHDGRHQQAAAALLGRAR